MKLIIDKSRIDDPVRAQTQLGEFELTILSDGTYYLDGGAMFGVVPKPMWEKRMPADEKNRILLGLNTVVVRTGKHTVVIETGIGNKLNEKMRAIHETKEHSNSLLFLLKREIAQLLKLAP